MMIEYIKDKYLTWRTGNDKQTRTWLKWEEENILQRARTIETMFMNFKYILPVTTQIFNHAEPFGWYPNKELGNNAVYYFARGERNHWDGYFHFDEMFGGDQVFVATNNERDAIMIALKYT